MEERLPTMTAQLQTFEEFQKEVEDYFLMKSPLPATAILASYILFILVGPSVMNSAKPFQLKFLLKVYNLIQVVFCSYILIQPFLLEGVWQSYAKPCRVAGTPTTYHPHVTYVTWLYFMAKALDFMDTVFIVLRKKSKQISFLHLYHHIIMFSSTWFFNKYVPDPSLVILQFLNTAVHLIMYTYYFISALGPKFAKYIWWKRYMTAIQLGQFGIAIFYIISIWFNGCEVPKTMAVYMVANISVLLILFSNFYINAYIKPNKNK